MAYKEVDSISTIEKITKISEQLELFLKTKNLNYGDSALNPIKIFSKEDISKALDVRIDDKLSRIKNSEELRKNDVVDLMGYLVFKCIEKGWFDWGDQID